MEYYWSICTTKSKAICHHCGFERNLIKNQKTKNNENNTARENLKASAKAKLIAGEPLTEEEANTIVL